MKKKYLDLYYEWMESGEIPEKYCNGNTGGLCGIFDKDRLFQLLKPTPDELETRRIWGYWGLDGDENNAAPSAICFNTLRQNIVLLMAAMAGEL